MSGRIGPKSNRLLDLYSDAAVAYSFRKLRSKYTGNAFRVRRSDDGSEQDVGFLRDEIDFNFLLDFIGSADGLLVKWYDQSGNSMDIQQTTPTLQPKIVSSGSLIYENGKICMEYNEDYLTGSYQLTDDSNMLISCVFRVNTANTTSHPRIGAFNSSSNSVNFQYGFNTSNYYYIRKDSATTYANSTFTMYNTQRLLMFGATSDVNYIEVNGTSFTSLTAGGSPVANSSLGNGMHLLKGYTTNAGYLSTGTFQEIVMWNTDQVSNKLGIKSNQNSYYSIY